MCFEYEHYFVYIFAASSSGTKQDRSNSCKSFGKLSTTTRAPALLTPPPSNPPYHLPFSVTNTINKQVTQYTRTPSLSLSPTTHQPQALYPSISLISLSLSLSQRSLKNKRKIRKCENTKKNTKKYNSIKWHVNFAFKCIEIYFDFLVFELFVF